jgi:hypothetical protein
MAVKKNKTQVLQGDPTYLEVRGSLIGSEYIPSIVRLQAKDQDPRSYQLTGTLAETVARDYAAASVAWNTLLQVRGKRTPAAVQTFLLALLREGLGFSSLTACEPVTIEDVIHPVNYSALGGQVPVIIASTVAIDERSDELLSGKKRCAAFPALQSYLNAQPTALWGLACDSTTLRLARDNASLSRYAYIETHLPALFEQEGGFARFTALWLLCHQTRFGAEGTPVDQCPLESWRKAARERGTRARDGMRHQVQEALKALGCGFLEHSDNEELRTALQDGKITLESYYEQLLRVVYRLMALAVLEDRGVVPTPGGSESIRREYWNEYSLRELRKKAVMPGQRSRMVDMWEIHKTVCGRLDQGHVKLALPRLGGPFAAGRCADLDACTLTNERLLDALKQLCYTHDDQVLTPVNWRDMGMEELGSVYESLLELQPQLLDEGRTFALESEGSGKGSKRKSTGSYYTPEVLVQALLDSGLDPLLKVARAAGDRDAQLKATLALRVLDAACGSAHMLIAAAHRIAQQVAELQSEGAPTPKHHQHALRQVLGQCIFGVDKNPMVIDIIDTGFWMDSIVDGCSAGFFAHHIRCGDSLAGLLDVRVLREGIPDGAYKVLNGDSKAVCRAALQQNREARKRPVVGEDILERDLAALAQDFSRLEAMEDITSDGGHRKAEAWQTYQKILGDSPLYRAAQLYMAAYLCPKGEGDRDAIPTTQDLQDAFSGKPFRLELAPCLQAVVDLARPLHWSLTFPNVMAQGGFDLVIMNPPWERITLKEQEFFGARSPAVVAAKNKAARGQEIRRLERAGSGSADRAIYDAFVLAKHASLGLSNYVHEASRFAQSGRGDVNMYALFTETALNLRHERGRAALIVPSGIATDDGTQELFGFLAQGKQIVSMFDFENRKGIFQGVHKSTKFCLLTLGKARSMVSAFYLTDVDDVDESERLLDLTTEDLRLFNPNTKTSPTFRSRRDLEIARKIYQRVPILWNEPLDGGNPWDVRFSSMFHMSNDSGLFTSSFGKKKMQGMLPLYEAKMFHQFDHRWATCEFLGDKEGIRDVGEEEKESAEFIVAPRFFVPAHEVEKRLTKLDWMNDWLMVFRGIARATDARTMFAAAIPISAVGNGAPLILSPSSKAMILEAILNSLVFDYLIRQKVGNTNINLYILKQIPVIPPIYFNKKVTVRLERAVKRLQWPLFSNPANAGKRPSANERARIRAELDAYLAAAYGLDRRDLAFILDPQNESSAHSTHPSETFSVLKRDEENQFDEYRTERLTLEAWDHMEERGELPEPYTP